MINYELAEARRWFAEDVRVRAPVLRNLAVAEAFARVPRERFLGPGPWCLLGLKPYVTSDTDPRWLYHDVVITIDEAKKLNNGQPSFWAHIFDNLDLRLGERVMQVGAATGYYSAILAEIVGGDGRVTAIEADLATRARENLKPWPHVEVVEGDGTTYDAGEVDAVIVFAGATHPAPLWLDRLAEGGRLVLPLTSANRFGFVLRTIRHGDVFDAASISGVGIYSCVGARDHEAAERLQSVLKGKGAWDNLAPIRALYRGEPPIDAADRVWYHGPGFWLERKMTGRLPELQGPKTNGSEPDT